MLTGYQENGREKTVSPQSPLPVAEVPLPRGPSTPLDLTANTVLVLAPQTRRVNIQVDVPGGVYLAFTAAEAVPALAPHSFPNGARVIYNLEGGTELHFAPMAAAFIPGDLIRAQEWGG